MTKYLAEICPKCSPQISRNKMLHTARFALGRTARSGIIRPSLSRAFSDDSHGDFGAVKKEVNLLRPTQSSSQKKT